VAAVFSSDLAHAADTVRIAVGGGDLPVLHDWRLRECDFGELNGAPVAEVERVRPRHLYEPFPGGESYVEATARVAACLEDLRRGWPTGWVLIIGHRATLHALDHLLNGIPLADAVARPFSWQPGWRYELTSR
jgi:broad specificity phosphatase PhoE